MAAVDYFLKIDGIAFGDGSTADFEVLSFSIGVSNTAHAGPTGRGAGRSSGRSSFQNLVVVKRLDKASPALFLASASGKLLPGATLSLVPAVQLQGGTTTGLIGLLYKFKLSDVLIESVQYKGSELGDSVPLEEVSLNFGKIEVSYGGANG
ncbi:MAG TPA: type VI secretion system tube protein Hcp [Armatimonadota bacterium]|nr:type VI secretion system tube protein Hcp [Armatimonadota bacterium]